METIKRVHIYTYIYTPKHLHLHLHLHTRAQMAEELDRVANDVQTSENLSQQEG